MNEQMTAVTNQVPVGRKCYGGFYVSHEANRELAQQVADMAAQRGFVVCHNASSWGNHDGWHRYVIHSTPVTCYAITGRSVQAYWETRYSSWSQPSIVGEARCLRSMIRWLDRH